MPALLSSALRTFLQQRQGSIAWLWELTLPTQTYRLSFAPTASAGLGQYHGRVVSSAPIRRAVSDSDHALQLSNTAITFECTAFDLQRELEGSGADSVRGSRVVVKLGAKDPSVTHVDFFTAFDGVIEGARRAGKLLWTLSMHSDDAALKGFFPKTPVLPGDFPNVLDRGLYGKALPLIYGIHDSRGSGDTGLVPCPYIDTVGFRYLVAHGWVTVDRVYKDGTLVGSGYSITHPTINGRLYTLIDFTSDQGATAVITADVTGYESVGNGSGSLLTGVNALKHALTNWIYGDYQGGNWPADHALISASHFTAAQTFLTDMGWQKASRYYGLDAGKITGRDAFDEFCRAFQLFGFFTPGGKIAVAADDHRATTLSYDSPRWFRWDQDELEDSLSYDEDRSRIAGRIEVDFLYGQAAGAYLQKTEVRDASISTNEPADSLQLRASHAGLL